MAERRAGVKGKPSAKGVVGRPAAVVPLPEAVIAPARRLALALLLQIEGGREHSDDVLRGEAMARLSRADRNLCTALVMGVLRWQIALDAELRPLLARPEQRLAVEVMLALRMGALQLLYMDRIPPHAALSESVELCRAAGQAHAAGMVNAVLRRVAGAREATRSRGVPLWESTAAFAERLGHPAWLVERWVATYGRAAAMLLCEGGQREPGAENWFADPVTSPDAAVDGAWDPEDAEGGAAGTAAEMDAGSRLVAELAVAACPAARRIWDCCAAPGGKTRVMAQRLPEAAVLASDASARRLASMRERFASWPPMERVRLWATTAEGMAEEEGNFDLVLCDVPCSGTGTLSRNPEIRHRLQPEELARQAMRQASILRAAMRRVAPAGRLVYATCSLEPEEGEAVVAAVLGEGGWRLVPAGELLERLSTGGVLREEVGWRAMVRGEVLRTLPGRDRCDGFYAAVLERTGD